MKLNDKTYKEWTESDLRVLLNNEDFREGQFLDYKRIYEFIEPADQKQKAKAKNEFRNDVCAFSNADGGDLIIGVAETAGVASAFTPIPIDNIDKCELTLRNALLPIQPAMPPVDFKFIPVDGNYVIVVHIEKGIYRPYMTVEDETIFRFFVRRGNRKEPMSYSEISNSFLHAATLANEIKRFRLERISELLEDDDGMFGVIHIIPATFMNPADFIPICDLCRSGKVPIPVQLNNFIRGRMLSNVDGVWFPSEDGHRDFQILRLFNNGAVELKDNLWTQIVQNEQFLVSDEFISNIEEVIEGTVELYKALDRNPSMFICVSVLNSKGYWNYDSHNIIHPLPSKVDRDRILCTPIEIKDLTDADDVQTIIEECKKMTSYALGKRW